MNTSAIKAVRDFWHERTRTLLVVLAIALGIAAFTAVLASYAVLTRALSEGYLATNPASATLFTDGVDTAMLAAVRANPEVAEAEARRTVRARIRTGAASWRPITLFVLSHFDDVRVSTMQAQAGAWSPASGEI